MVPSPAGEPAALWAVLFKELEFELLVVAKDVLVQINIEIKNNIEIEINEFFLIIPPPAQKRLFKLVFGPELN